MYAAALPSFVAPAWIFRTSSESTVRNALASRFTSAL
jgi:hypothetical protein